VKAPVIARLEPSPNRGVEHDEIGPGLAVQRQGGALEMLLRDGHADPDGLRERLHRATAVALRPWT
jgi:hypothetical protein